MSQPHPLPSAKGSSLPAVSITVRNSRIWWTGAVSALACQFALMAPAAASPSVVALGTSSPCTPEASSVVSKSEAILGRQMSALEALKANQRLDVNPACLSASTVSSEKSQVAVRTIGTEAYFAKAIEVSAIMVNPSLLAQALVNLNDDLFSEKLKPFSVAAFNKPTAPLETKFVASQETIADSTNAKLALAEVSSPNKLPTTLISKAPGAVPAVTSQFSGKPDIFGSVALKVSHTPLDWKWSGAQNGREAAMTRAALISAGATVGTIHKEENIRAVNRWINANIQYVEDSKLYGRADHWASAGTTLKSRRGDCEDFAIAKMQLLQASGVKPSDMFLVIAKDLVRRVDHSLLVIRVGDEMLVLDNETDRILNAQDVHDYRPIMSYSANGKWLHGYPAKPKGTQVASLAVGR